MQLVKFRHIKFNYSFAYEQLFIVATFCSMFYNSDDIGEDRGRIKLFILEVAQLLTRIALRIKVKNNTSCDLHFKRIALVSKIECDIETFSTLVKMKL